MFLLSRNLEKGRRKSSVRSFRQNQELRFSRIIFLVTAASFITWMPSLYYIIVGRVSSVPTRWSAVFLFLLTSSFISVTRLSTLLSTFLGFLVTERLCFLYVDSNVSCKSARQFETSTSSTGNPASRGIWTHWNIQIPVLRRRGGEKWCIPKLYEQYTQRPLSYKW